MLLPAGPYERGQNRLSNVAGLRCALHPAGSENLDWYMSIVGSMHGWMELAHQVSDWYSRSAATPVIDLVH